MGHQVLTTGMGALAAAVQDALPSPNAPGKAPNHIHTTLRCGRAPGKPSLAGACWAQTDWLLIGLSSAIAFPFKLGQGPTWSLPQRQCCRPRPAGPLQEGSSQAPPGDPGVEQGNVQNNHLAGWKGRGCGPWACEITPLSSTEVLPNVRVQILALNGSWLKGLTRVEPPGLSDSSLAS